MSFPAASQPAWSFRQNKDPMTDKVTAHAILTGDVGSLGVGCSGAAGSDPGVSIIVVTDEFLGQDILGRGRPGRVRFDDRKMSETTWHYGSNGAWPDDAETANFVARLLAAQKLAIQLTTFEDHNVTIAFDASGGQDALRQVYAACGYSLPAPNSN